MSPRHCFPLGLGLPLLACLGSNPAFDEPAGAGATLGTAAAGSSSTATPIGSDSSASEVGGTATGGTATGGSQGTEVATCDEVHTTFGPDDSAWVYSQQMWSPGPPLALDDCSYGWALRSGASWGDVSVAADVRLDSTCGFGLYGGPGLLVQAAEAQTCAGIVGHYCVVSTRGDELQIGTTDAGCFPDTLNRVDLVDPMTEGLLYRLTLGIEVDVLTCRLEGGDLAGALEVSALVNNVLGFGTVGVTGEGARVSFESLDAYCA